MVHRAPQFSLLNWTGNRPGSCDVRCFRHREWLQSRGSIQDLKNKNNNKNKNKIGQRIQNGILKGMLPDFIFEGVMLN